MAGSCPGHPRHSLNKRPDGPQSQSGGFREEMNHLALPGIKTQLLDKPVSSPIIIQTEFGTLSKKGQESIVGIVTCYVLDMLGIESWSE